MRILPKSDYPATGDCVKTGTYSCMYCNGNNPATCVINENGEELPQCPICKTDVEWYPVSVAE